MFLSLARSCYNDQYEVDQQELPASKVMARLLDIQIHTITTYVLTSKFRYSTIEAVVQVVALAKNAALLGEPQVRLGWLAQVC